MVDATLTPVPAHDAPFETICHRLSSAGIVYRPSNHAATHSALAEALATRTPPHRMAKAVALRVGDRWASVVLPASERLSLRKVRALLGGVPVRLATEEELIRDLHVDALGALSPFGGGAPSPQLVDRRVLSSGWVLVNGGDQRHSLRVDPLAIVMLSRARVADLCDD